MTKQPSKQETLSQTIGVFAPIDDQLRAFIQRTRDKHNLPPDGSPPSELSPDDPLWQSVYQDAAAFWTQRMAEESPAPKELALPLISQVVTASSDYRPVLLQSLAHLIEGLHTPHFHEQLSKSLTAHVLSGSAFTFPPEAFGQAFLVPIPESATPLSSSMRTTAPTLTLWPSASGRSVKRRSGPRA